MLKMPIFVSICAAGLMTILGAGAVSGQSFPSKPVRILTSETGGGSDMVARLIAQDFTTNFGQPGIVDNRNGMVAAGLLAKAQPDGHTLLFFSSSIWIAPFLQDNLPYDPIKDFSPITLAMGSPNVLVVHPAVAANSAKELIALAKAKPGQLNYARTVLGGSPQLAAELFKSMAGLDIVSIPYKGAGPGVLGLISGEVQLMFPSSGAAVTHIKSGKVRALAVTSAQPSALVPGVPTLAATLPGYESASIIAAFAPAKTPAEVINLLNKEIVRFLNTPAVKDKLFVAGLEVYGTSPQEHAAKMKNDMAKMGKVIRDAGIRAE